MFVKYIGITPITVYVDEGSIHCVTDEVIEVSNSDYNELRQRFPGDFTAEEHGSNPVNSTPSGVIIDKTHAEITTDIAGSDIISGQWYKITDYQTMTETKMEVDLVSGAIEPLYVQGLTTNTLARVAYSDTYPDDIIYYDPTVITSGGPNNNKGTIFYRYDPINNIEAKMGDGGIAAFDTSDFRAAIQRRYDMTGVGNVAPKDTAYTVAITGAWGTTTETFAVDGLTYSTVSTVDAAAKNITLVGGLAFKNVTCGSGVDGLHSPNSDVDANYQGVCTNIDIEAGSVNSCIVLAGQTGAVIKNLSIVLDVVYKVVYVGLIIDNSSPTNWITAQKGPQNGIVFKDTQFSNGLDDLLFGSLSSGQVGRTIVGGDMNGLRFDITLTTGSTFLDFGDNLVTDTEFAGFIYSGSKIVFVGSAGITTNKFGTSGSGGGLINSNDLVISVTSGCSSNFIKTFNLNTGYISLFQNNAGPSGSLSSNHFDKCRVVSNTRIAAEVVNSNYFFRFYENNSIDGDIENNNFQQGITGCTIGATGALSGNSFSQLMDRITWSTATWTDCAVECQIPALEVYTSVQSREKLLRYDTVNNDLYKLTITASAPTYTVVA